MEAVPQLRCVEKLIVKMVKGDLRYGDSSLGSVSLICVGLSSIY